MTPKEKAQELLYRFDRQSMINRRHNHASYTDEEKIRYANRNNTILCVMQILKSLPPFDLGLECVAKIEYWENVKKELESL